MKKYEKNSAESANMQKNHPIKTRVNPAWISESQLSADRQISEKRIRNEKNW